LSEFGHPAAPHRHRLWVLLLLRLELNFFSSPESNPKLFFVSTFFVDL
jgi:hypothetical protein